MFELRVDSWRGFVETLEDFDTSRSIDSYSYAFRGHSNAAWSLKPSILRYLAPGIGVQDALNLEAATIREFKSQAHLHLATTLIDKTTDDRSWLALMQHFGAPTRMLDWSTSPFVAAYFAVHGSIDSDAAIWVVDMFMVQEYMRKTHGPEPRSKDYGMSDAPLYVCFGERITKFDRMVAQQGFFSSCQNILGDHGTIFEEVHSDQPKHASRFFGKIVIPSRLKPEIARKLRMMNITANSLFPGIDGLGKSVAELLELARFGVGES